MVATEAGTLLLCNTHGRADSFLCIEALTFATVDQANVASGTQTNDGKKGPELDTVAGFRGLRRVRATLAEDSGRG